MRCAACAALSWMPARAGRVVGDSVSFSLTVSWMNMARMSRMSTNSVLDLCHRVWDENVC